MKTLDEIIQTEVIYGKPRDHNTVRASLVITQDVYVALDPRMHEAAKEQAMDQAKATAVHLVKNHVTADLSNLALQLRRNLDTLVAEMGPHPTLRSEEAEEKLDALIATLIEKTTP